jgi:hypothetical protein
MYWSIAKKIKLWWTPFDVEWKNAAHLMDRTVNWCIGGCWFILAIQLNVQAALLQGLMLHW